MRALTVHPRYSVFSILDTLMSNHRESTPSFDFQRGAVVLTLGITHRLKIDGKGVRDRVP